MDNGTAISCHLAADCYKEATMPNASFYSRMGRLSSIIFILPSCMAVGGLLGYYVVDPYLGVRPWGTVVFVLLGAAAGFYEIIKILVLDQRNKNSKDD